MMESQHTSRARQRQGVVLAGAIVCMLLITAVTASVMQGVLQARHAAKRRHWDDQAHRLAEAGALRAVQLLQTDSEYLGEAWFPDHLEEPARVTITVKADIVKATADYPHDESEPHRRARHTVTLTIDDDPSANEHPTN